MDNGKFVYLPQLADLKIQQCNPHATLQRSAFELVLLSILARLDQVSKQLDHWSVCIGPMTLKFALHDWRTKIVVRVQLEDALSLILHLEYMLELHTVDLDLQIDPTTLLDSESDDGTTLLDSGPDGGFWKAAMSRLTMLSRLSRMNIMIRACDHDLVLRRFVLHPMTKCCL